MLEKTIALGKELSKKEMRNLKGGVAEAGDGSCCTTFVQDTGTNSTARVCGMSKQQAVRLADDLAVANGQPASWCCASC